MPPANALATPVRIAGLPAVCALLFGTLVATLLVGLLPGCAAERGARPPETAALAPFTVDVPGSDVRLDMVPVPAGSVEGLPVGPLWVSATEVTWDAFDAFVYGEGFDGVDAVSRPSAPYISMDRGFGHEGYPVLSVSARGARAFCDWLARATGRPLRLPTHAEWRHAAGPRPDDLGAHAWFRDNASGRTHPPAEKRPNRHGLYDVFGNAGEWCLAAGDRPLLAGGSYRDGVGDVGPDAARHPTPAWNASDPQLPRSVWWLADAPWAGFRVACGVD